MVAVRGQGWCGNKAAQWYIMADLSTIPEDKPAMPHRLVFCLLFMVLPTLAPAQVQILATIKPLQLIAAAVAVDGAAIRLLMAPGQSPHHHTLKPSDRSALADADLVIWVGEGLETHLAEVLSNPVDGRRILRLDQLDTITLLPLRAGHGDGHDHGRIDPHLWLHSGNALALAHELSLALSELDPANRDTYHRNYQRFSEQLVALRHEIDLQMQPLREHSFVVYHDAIQYFEAEFELQHALALVSDTEMQPGMRHIIRTRSAISEQQPRCLLTDNTASPSTIDTLLGGHRLRQVELDLLGSRLVPGQDGFADLFRRLAADIEACLGP